jgi:hypothetical protein
MQFTFIRGEPREDEQRTFSHVWGNATPCLQTSIRSDSESPSNQCKRQLRPEHAIMLYRHFCIFWNSVQTFVYSVITFDSEMQTVSCLPEKCGQVCTILQTRQRRRN